MRVVFRATKVSKTTLVTALDCGIKRGAAAPATSFEEDNKFRFAGALAFSDIVSARGAVEAQGLAFGWEDYSVEEGVLQGAEEKKGKEEEEFHRGLIIRICYVLGDNMGWVLLVGYYVSGN